MPKKFMIITFYGEDDYSVRFTNDFCAVLNYTNEIANSFNTVEVYERKEPDVIESGKNYTLTDDVSKYVHIMTA